MSEILDYLIIKENGYIDKQDNIITLQNAVENDIRNSFPNPNLASETIFGNQVKIRTLQIEQTQNTLIKIMNINQVKTTSHLEITAENKGFYRKQGSFTINSVIFYGTPNTNIPLGFTIQDINNNIYHTIQNSIIKTNGQSDLVSVESEMIDVDSPVNTINALVDSQTGIDRVNNPQNFQIRGTPYETDTAFIKRIEDASNNITYLNTIQSFAGFIKKDPTVIDCKGLENPTDTTVVKNGITLTPHSISITCIGGSAEYIGKCFASFKGKAFGTNTISDQIAFFDNPDSIGTINYWMYNIPTIQNIQIQIQVETLLTTPPSYTSIIRQRILDYIYNNPFEIGQTLYANDFLKMFSDVSISVVNISIKKNTDPAFQQKISFNYLQYPLLNEFDIIFLV